MYPSFVFCLAQRVNQREHTRGLYILTATDLFNKFQNTKNVQLSYEKHFLCAKILNLFKAARVCPIFFPNAMGYAKLAGVVEPMASQIGLMEYIMTVASRLYFSHFYRLVYSFMIAFSVVCVAWTSINHWKIPSSMMFISLEITVSTLLVLEVLLRMMAFKKRFWQKWCNIFDIVALVMSLVSVAMYFNEEGVLGELEAVAADSVLALRNAVQYVRLALFLKNRSDRPTTIGKDINFENISADPDGEREMMLNAESGIRLDSDDEENFQAV
ncbi:wsc domain-containing protein [Plasmopara halstedii]|uniref:Wsc domain-containing protein n=1 Tax=Plasmopara halstedii TaxID=4781 RepID=A0A0P1A7B3_PLAHL|nr:wsc domain-containing protein [Plasmopara halstedii]CEG36072.1 wsc domain-containing protein [Plasmopara halstedii]|eukprot:XP_024572441.1 wsc domain-containing protein [Plasmopara halstedii]